MLYSSNCVNRVYNLQLFLVYTCIHIPACKHENRPFESIHNCTSKYGPLL